MTKLLAKTQENRLAYGKAPVLPVRIFLEDIKNGEWAVYRVYDRMYFFFFFFEICASTHNLHSIVNSCDCVANKFFEMTLFMAHKNANQFTYFMGAFLAWFVGKMDAIWWNNN